MINHWKNGAKTKEERPTPVSANPVARDRRREKYRDRQATVGAKVKAQPKPVKGKKGGVGAFREFKASGNNQHCPATEHRTGLGYLT